MEFFGVPVRSFNIEITNRCTLACPECPRTGNPWVTRDLVDLPVSVLERVFTPGREEQFRGLRVNLCGAYGDCIYHPDFHAVLRFLKHRGLKVSVETNGSHRKPQWWRRTCELLDEDDAITFSVDGLADTNHLYRVNARWEDIVSAMKLCAERVTVSWKYIVFRHNEHQIEAAQALGRQLGVHKMTFKKSARFRCEDPLAPSNPDFIGVVTRNRRHIQSLASAGGAAEAFDEQVRIQPKCLYGKDLAITARGYFFPCTSCESADETTWFHRNRDHFDLRAHAIEDILRSPKWQELRATWERASTAPSACLYYCGMHESYAQAYVTGSRPDRPNKPDDAVCVELAAKRVA